MYYGTVFKPEDSARLFSLLSTKIVWENDILYMFGKQIITDRRVAWYGNKAYPYNYSNHTRVALPWTQELLYIRDKIEHISSETYNSCLLNIYRSGEEGMSWHSDNEKELEKNAAIASVSLGAERKFSFKHKQTKESHSVLLENGSLLVMKGEIQHYWKHALPKSKKVKNPRINLTFRKIQE